jgi:hypothetical protein
MIWADYCISKMSFDNSRETITECLVHEDNGTSIGSGDIKNHYCPTKIGHKIAISLFSKGFQLKKNLFQNPG